MKILGKKSLRITIISIVLFICFLVIGLGFTIVTIRYIQNVKQDTINSIKIDARLIGEYCTTSLLFNYPDRAKEILIKLESLSIISCGIVYDESDQVFATYKRSTKIDPLPEFHKEAFYQFDGDILHVWEPIVYQNKRYGSMYIRADTKISKKVRQHIMMIMLLFAGMLLLTYFLASILQKKISKPILNVIDAAQHISSKGDYSIRLVQDRDDELGQLYQSFNNMIEMIDKRTSQIKADNWFKKGQAELNEILRGEQTLETMGNKLIQFLVDYLDVQVATLYSSNQKNMLKNITAYAIQNSEIIPKEIPFGEGLIGQAALSQKPVHLTRCPKNYIQVSSSLGHVPPEELLIFPLIENQNVRGVIELATVYSFSSRHIAFLENVAESIAISILSIESRNRMSHLLKQTQDQAHELKVREEELSQTNEALEQKNRVLEDHQIDIEMKNSELKIAQKTVEEKIQELELSNKYKSEFLANMSHELRTPLNSILLLSKLLSEKKEHHFSEDDVESALTIYNSGTELLNLINEILDLSKIEAGKVRIHVHQTRISTIAENMKKFFEPVAKDRGLDFHVSIAQDIPEQIFTDRQRTEQIVKNFLSNAMKFTQKGSVSLNISRPAQSKDISIMLHHNGLDVTETIAFSVIDTGIGIPQEQQQLIFEAFQQVDGATSRKFGGTGLGLSISREFAKLLGGVIKLKSEKDKGSTFTLYLPEKKKNLETYPIINKRPFNEKDVLKEDEKKQIEIPADTTRHSDKAVETSLESKQIIIEDDREDITSEDKSILIIEDDPYFLKALAQQSRQHHFKTLIADTGELGLHLAEIYNPKAIILDIKLPGIDGWTVIERLKSNPSTRHIPINCITATEDNNKAKKKGVLTYLIKPVDQNDLDLVFKKVEQVISKRIKDLLIVEDNKNQAEAVKKLIGTNDINICIANTGNEAIEVLGTRQFDCVILDLKLPDISGFELLSLIRQQEDSDVCQMPVIVYTGKDLEKNEINVLDEFAHLTIFKGEKTSQRLFDQTTLFLHRIDKGYQEKQHENIHNIHDQDAILSDKTILIVDDDMRNVYSLKKLLSEKNIHVLVAKNGKEGVARIYEKPNIDLVLMDIMMPEMDGYEAITKIRADQQFEQLPIIALTAKAMKGDRSKCLQIGANDYISKPLDIDKLFSIMCIWLYKDKSQSIPKMELSNG
jgi:CheY-like chemotaxis protein/HAMP domain-containing protein